MSASPENESTKAYRQMLHEYRRKFPEIPEKDLLNIVKKYASDPETCDLMLRRESDKGMYGSSPTADPVLPADPLGNLRLTAGRNRVESTPPFDLPRSNSTGSAGSSHSSGRSTPVNPIPTPWIAPPRYPTPAPLRQITPPMALPPGTLFINGNFYQPYRPRPGPPGQVSPIDNQMGTPSTLPRVTNSRTSSNAAYPIYSTNGYFQTSVAGTPAQNQPTTMVSSKTVGPGVSIPTSFFTPTRQTQGYPTMSYATTPPYDQNYMQGTYRMATPNQPNAAGYRTTGSSNQPQDHRMLLTDEPRVSNAGITPGRVAGSAAQMDTRFQTKPHRNLKNPLHVQTSPGVITPEMSRKFSGPNEHPDDLEKVLGGMAISHRPPVANDDYIKACLSQQQRRFDDLQKEYIHQKERLGMVIKDITEKDGEIMMKFLVAPNPTDGEVAKLSEENDILKKYIADISQNIDRVDSGLALIPPFDSDLHDTQRIDRKDFDRSQSVPCLHVDPVRPMPPLSRPLSEHDMVGTRPFFNNNQKHERPMIEDWNFINPSIIADPTPPDENNGEDETQWSCPRCTFLNHNSLTVCEMCSSSRNSVNMLENY
ncbi:TGF-beta-activated kinase 1 and MAP3K7-binding protein 3-like isoform X1 [Dendronephthya gigantea]|uniref:TGF-beta-activated kinase 1 and MAP3K7-binding protein 3-like isoform X1 n=1 Tax=Dendronephthya gigantea TaxID=151771 RepID=UPI00106963EC|nr:TGF-beta-activated kinase 1 and MAP3K7-binding protein 3-like isoform X1 [Dendronephthya gigantea]